ncbi:hypothetical protein [Psychromonas antarctica]|uniref:hypothetical protein n=1 Tax=Psychromonas antarctica TaxID=67573 RepID=UPI001EE88A78|nr:hypothetical protein [Psychromonas antarctica]MCG6200621.1 hypothetical protein [Psychromonas antarctica]
MFDTNHFDKLYSYAIVMLEQEALRCPEITKERYYQRVIQNANDFNLHRDWYKCDNISALDHFVSEFENLKGYGIHLSLGAAKEYQRQLLNI